MNKKVVILHPAYWEQAMGGAELQISHLIEHMRSHQIEVHYIFEDKKKHYSNKQNIYLHPLKSINIKKRLGSRWFFYKKAIEKKLQEIGPDIIYTRFYSSWSGFATNYAIINNCKHIWAVAHDNDLYPLNIYTLFYKPFEFVEYYFMKKVFRCASYIIVQNNFQMEILKKRFNREGVKINQSTEFVSEVSIAKIKNLINILWIANLKPMKRPELFIELVKKMDGISGIRFKMIGRLHDNYKEIIDDAKEQFEHFEYLGEITNEEVNNLLLNGHILINTSNKEGFSNTFVQAWMRKVVVISMNSNPDNIITNQNIGFICSAVDDVVDKLEILIGDNKLLQAMGNKAYNYAIEHHRLEENLNKVMDLMM